MSVKLNGTTITMTRGDTAAIEVSMTRDGDPYLPVAGDTVRFAAKHPKMTSGNKQYKDEEPVLEDTKSLDFGEYVYDIQITFADGTVDTFITTAPFVLTPEVD